MLKARQILKGSSFPLKTNRSFKNTFHQAIYDHFFA